MRNREPLTAAQANRVWDLLIEHAGASEHGRENFVFLETDHWVSEYRFIGGLGFGGKFYRDPDRWRVGAYPEDIKGRPDRDEAIRLTNAALAGLYASHAALEATLAKHPDAD